MRTLEDVLLELNCVMLGSDLCFQCQQYKELTTPSVIKNFPIKVQGKLYSGVCIILCEDCSLNPRKDEAIRHVQYWLAEGKLERCV